VRRSRYLPVARALAVSSIAHVMVNTSTVQSILLERSVRLRRSG
jgi:hypothetical protein